MSAISLYSTWPDRESAETGARALIERRLIACANILPSAVSIYRWEGDIVSESEVVMFAKTSSARAEEACAALAALHPYETPCVVALEISPDLSHAPYLAWISSETSAT